MIRLWFEDVRGSSTPFETGPRTVTYQWRCRACGRHRYMLTTDHRRVCVRCYDKEQEEDRES
jgi:hypothetical protein